MNVLIPILAAIGLFIVIGRWYSRHLAKVLGEDPNRPAPAVTKADGVDYVPTRTPIAFAQHFAAIAGAGPILGPIFALVYGWQWCWLWVVFGALFFGAVHDYFALFMSVREEGATIVGLAKKYMGNAGYTVFIAFVVTMLLIVNAVFLIVSAKALTSVIPAAQMHLTDTTRHLFTVDRDDNTWIGGIGSTSVLIITLFAPLLGWLYVKKKVSTLLCSALAVGLCALSVYLGILWPIPLGHEALWGFSGMTIWIALLGVYCLIAAGLPLWMLIQSRDFINVHILYGGLAILVFGLFSIGLFQRGTIQMSATPQATLAAQASALEAQAVAPKSARTAEAKEKLAQYEGAVQTKTAAGLPGPVVTEPTYDFSGLAWIWPGLFVLIACGAVSGFHSLCASGTASRQVTSEPAARQVGVWAMLLEGLLAVLVIVSVSYAFSGIGYARVLYPNRHLLGGGNPATVFAQAVGTVGYDGLGIPMALGTIFGLLMLEGFLVTTLDTSVRLTRYLLEEMLGMILPGKKFNLWLTTLAVVLGSVGVTAVGAGNVMRLWQVFGTGNQLLAAFGLIVASLWLIKTGRNAIYALIPACFMLVTTITMLIEALYGYIRHFDLLLIVTCALVLFLGLMFLVSAVINLVKRFSGREASAPAA
ncbi:MAG: carbon starvation CstA family protein [Planctomycetota bacterium]